MALGTAQWACRVIVRRIFHLNRCPNDGIQWDNTPKGGQAHTARDLARTLKRIHGKTHDRTMTMKEEKRSEIRSPKLRNHRAEIKLVAQPIYQFKVADVSLQGAGLVVHESSAFLKLIEVGQVMEVNFISPQGAKPHGAYKVQIRHITDKEHSRYKGVRLVGVRILERLKDT